ncbi:hypothetical protein [Photobacterium leiognathi]|uniref:hypothetical protein n=1 Tax=Photobacterium leiognathi TaxID=553611 RepID=UPI0029816108|nr:hypothetical protein [Photobacterium leiognathi]
MTTINANNRKCNRERIASVYDVYQRLLELQAKKVELLHLESTGTVMMFVANKMVFNSALDCDSDNLISVSSMINTFQYLDGGEAVKSFNHGWSLVAVSNSEKRYLAVDASKVEHFKMPKISFERHKEHLLYHVNSHDEDISSCPFELFCETVGINTAADLAPVFDFDKASVRKWKSNGIPLAIAVRTSVITQMNVDYVLGESKQPFVREQY